MPLSRREFIALSAAAADEGQPPPRRRAIGSRPPGWLRRHHRARARPAASGILHPDRRIDGLADSKTCTFLQRERLYDEICRKSVSWTVVSVDPEEIDRINIHQATLQAMRRAVLALAPLPDAVLVDAFRIPSLPMAQRGVIGGDRRASAIAAASIMAKVTRDRLMQALHHADPRYGFDRHKGYATADHLSAVSRFRYSSQHRRTFRPATLFDNID